MTPYHVSERATFYNGDCRLVMSEMEDNSVDSIVCDPPYEFGFMGRQWDSTGVAYDVCMWQQCLRILKPGGHLLAFGGARTYHRMACAVEDAGFEIRDQIMYVYGSGFPKSLNISKAIDNSLGAERTKVTYKARAATSGTMVNNQDTRPRIEKSRIAGYHETDGLIPVSNMAKKWDGFGTSLKPSHEPIVVARKPLNGTVVANVLQYGTGAININRCRIAGEPVPINRLVQWSGFGQEKRPDYEQELNTLGRWPANLIHDGSDEVLALFPDTGKSSSSLAVKEYEPNGKNKIFGEGMGGGWHSGFEDGGSAARFFYCAKASVDDRQEGNEDDGNIHPTVKPTSLMRYLCRLVTPPSGIVLDPFMGSGSTYKAAYQEGLNFVGIELDEIYCAIAIKRVSQTVLNFTP